MAKLEMTNNAMDENSIKQDLERTAVINKPEVASADNGDSTIRPDTTDATLRPDNMDATIRPEKQSSPNKGGDVEFLLKGRIYHNVKCLSDNSGEAQVFLVEGEEGERVLKIYYPNFTIKKTLIRIIQNMNMEMIVKVEDYGKTYIDGKNRDYELMEYFRGGTLGEYDLEGDFNQFRRIALQAAAALAL